MLRQLLRGGVGCHVRHKCPTSLALCTLLLLQAKPGPTRGTGGLPRIARWTAFCPTHRGLDLPLLMKADRGTGILALTCPGCL